MPTYATPADLGELLAPAPAPANAARLLARASRIIARETLCAVYDVDQAGLPTSQTLKDALRDATCEQVAYWLETGRDEGIGTGYTSVGIGSVNLTRAGAGGGDEDDGDACEQALLILQQAGLTGHGPVAC
ncbi:hypothetical protein [Thermomonospora cellulosilytica]|uniref:Uncharacterized protein n=1 Tax=Thermomonospora cellulosilytica TaxID=1411118 RepID=A0A7W3R8H6_9ACTN|nr:hypothetical protein [Thermomonospora cellulosilytica]MBA9003736.1 hypothetical protein [Thermomonospora cellulosilytica]